MGLQAKLRAHKQLQRSALASSVRLTAHHTTNTAMSLLVVVLMM
jgi:hypothetical protein